jgi:hypothetical protein
MMASLIAGAIAMGYVVAGLFFLRFWRETRDRLFLAFAVSFALLAVQRVALALVGGTADAALALYALRALAFLLLIAAIVDKNRPARG